MGTVQAFHFGEREVRVIMVDDDPWWVAKDVCDVLDIQNTTQTVQQLDEDERAMFNIGRQGFTNIISESGLYSLIIRSRKSEAKAFRRWITHDVLPSIRKSGAYTVPAAPVNPQSPLVEYEQITKLLQMLRMGIRDKLFNENTERVIRWQIAETIVGEPLRFTSDKEEKQERPQWVKDGYAAKVIGLMCGTSAIKVGITAKKHGLQTEEYGGWYEYSNLKGQSLKIFIYNEMGKEKLVQLLKSS